MAEGVKDILRNCKQATLVALKKEEGKSTLGERARLFVHLLFCDACKQFIKQSALINKAMQRLYSQMHKDPTYQLSPEARQRIQEKLDKQS